MLLFRGTQTASHARTSRGIPSWTPSLLVATIYSANPGDVWSSRPAMFTKTSTVHVARLDKPRVLDLRGLGITASLSQVLASLGFPYGIDEDEVRRIYNYLHNRVIGKAKGGEFNYHVFQYGEDEPVHESDVPLSFLTPESAFSWVGRDEWDDDPSMETAGRTEADTFIFADAPAVQRAAKAAGFDAIAYVDIFQGGVYAAEELLGLTEDEFLEAEGIDMDIDLEDEDVVVHDTWRILNSRAVSGRDKMSVDEAIEMLGMG